MRWLTVTDTDDGPCVEGPFDTEAEALESIIAFNTSERGLTREEAEHEYENEGRDWIVPYPEKPKRVLVVEYDVTGLTDQQVGRLELEAVVQAERSKDTWGDVDDGHPDVPVKSRIEERP